MCTMCPVEKVPGSLELEFQMVVSHRVDAGNWSWVLCKSVLNDRSTFYYWCDDNCYSIAIKTNVPINILFLMFIHLMIFIYFFKLIYFASQSLSLILPHTVPSIPLSPSPLRGGIPLMGIPPPAYHVISGIGASSPTEARQGSPSERNGIHRQATESG